MAVMRSLVRLRHSCVVRLVITALTALAFKQPVLLHFIIECGAINAEWEKPINDTTVSRLVFAGCAAFDTSVFSYIPARKRGHLSLENDVFPELIAGGRLFGYPFEGPWFDVSTPEIYEQALQHWPKDSVK